MLTRIVKNKRLAIMALFLVLPLAISACSPAEDDLALTSGTWQWETLTEADPSTELQVSNPEDYTLTFAEDGTVSMKVDCNQAMGDYALEGDALTITPGPITLAYCGEESLDQQFMDAIVQVVSFNIEGDRLTLVLDEGVGEMVFSQN